MKLLPKQMERIALEVLSALDSNPSIKITGESEKIKTLIQSVLKQNIEDELKLDEEVQKMMDVLEQQNPGGFERYKMFPLLKKKLAEKKGFVL